MIKSIVETRNINSADAEEIVDFVFNGFRLSETDITDVAAFDAAMRAVPAYLRDEIRHGLQISSITPVIDDEGRICDYIAELRFLEEAKNVREKEFNPYRWIMSVRKCNIREAILTASHADIIANGDSVTFRYIIENMQLDEIIAMADELYHPDFDEKETLYCEYNEYTYRDPEYISNFRQFDDCHSLTELYKAAKERKVNIEAYNIRRNELERAVDCNELTDAIFAIAKSDKIKFAKIKRRLIDITYNGAQKPQWMTQDRINRLWKAMKHRENKR